MKALVKLSGKHICLAVLAAAISLSVGSVSATVLVRLDIAELAETSSSIVEGIVERVDTSSKTKNGGIETTVIVRVQEHWKGANGPDYLTLRLPGGQQGNQIYLAAGVPGFIVGEAVLLFLEPVEDGWIPMGLSQGVFRIGNRGVERTVSQVVGEGMFVAVDEEKTLQKTTPPGPTNEVPYRQFRAEIELLMGKKSVEKSAVLKPVILR